MDDKEKKQIKNRLHKCNNIAPALLFNLPNAKHVYVSEQIKRHCIHNITMIKVALKTNLLVLLKGVTGCLLQASSQP